MNFRVGREESGGPASERAPRLPAPPRRRTTESARPGRPGPADSAPSLTSLPPELFDALADILADALVASYLNAHAVDPAAGTRTGFGRT